MFNPDKFNWRVYHSKEKIPTHVSIWLLDINRGHLEVGSFQNSWARRSTFTIGKTNLLVTEIFLESLYA